MGNLRELAVSLLSKTTGVDMTSVAKQTLYTCPIGKVGYVTEVVIVDPSASLAGGTSYSFGRNSAGDDWISAIDLSSLTTSGTGYTFVRPANGAEAIEIATTEIFGINAATAATAGTCTATVFVFGFVI